MNSNLICFNSQGMEALLLINFAVEGSLFDAIMKLGT